MGASSATLTGRGVMKATLHSAASSALAMTACYIAERAVCYTLHNDMNDQNDTLLDWRSHALGGVAGGALVGKIYNGRGIHGALFFTPVMMSCYFLDCKVSQYRDWRIKEVMKAKNNEGEQR